MFPLNSRYKGLKNPNFFILAKTLHFRDFAKQSSAAFTIALIECERMKVWLINCIDEERKRNIEKTYCSLGTAYLASYVRKYGGYSDLVLSEAGQKLTSEQIALVKPDIVGISSVTQNFDIAESVAKKIKKELDVPIIVGGKHISALPSTLSKTFSIAVIGEGEETFLELLRAYESHGLENSKLENLNGIAYKKDDKVRVTPRRKLIEPLDKIPFPARDLLDITKDNLHMLTSRGCPYHCVFCASAAFWQRARFNSAGYVVSEIKHLVETYHADNINLLDDLFIANKKRLMEIAQLIKTEGLHNKVSFTCLARANLVDVNIVSVLKHINVTTVNMGLESGCEKTLNFLKCGSVKVKQNMNAVNLLKRYGFHVVASFVIGVPGETWDDSMETLQFLKKARLNDGETYVLLPYPGTQLWNMAKQQGIVNENMDWSKFEIYFEDNPLNRVVVADKLLRTDLLKLLGMFNAEWERHKRRHVFIGRVKSVVNLIMEKTPFYQHN